MLENEIFKPIPGTIHRSISNYGRIRNDLTGNISIPENKNSSGYTLFQRTNAEMTKYPSAKRRVTVRSLVATLFVDNLDPYLFTEIINIDGNKENIRWDNLKWAMRSEVQLNAVDNGNRDVVGYARDYITGEIIVFKSLNMAKRQFGLCLTLDNKHLTTRYWGQLFGNRWEFRFKDDKTPWFYESYDKGAIKTDVRFKVIHEDQVSYLYTHDDVAEFCKLDVHLIRRVEFIKLSTMVRKRCQVTEVTIEYYEPYKRKNDIITRIIAMKDGSDILYIFDNIDQASKVTGVCTTNLRNDIDQLRPINGWYFADAKNQDACSDLVTHLKK